MIDNYIGKLTASDPGIFGFADLLAGLALMVIAWTLADTRYQFRIRVAPLPLRLITFYGLLFLSLLTLATDLWQANNWPILIIPGSFMSPALWESLLGLTLILIFFLWTTFAFISPPKFSQSNSRRFVEEVYSMIIGGAKNDKSIIADEMRRSIPAIVNSAVVNRKVGLGIDINQLKKIEVDATHLLQMFSDKRFCREIVDAVPLFALELFQEIGETEKHQLPVDIFARNFVEEAIRNKDSFLFHEDSFWESGTVGYEKPFSNTLFSNYRMVEAIGTQFDVGVLEDWDSRQWTAYFRVLGVFFESYLSNHFHEHSFVLARALSRVESCCHGLYELNNKEEVSWNHDTIRRLDALIDFIGDSIEALEKCKRFEGIRWRVDKEDISGDSVYDRLARLTLEIIRSASEVRSPKNLNWMVQHNIVWSKLFKSFKTEGTAAKIFQFKLRRLIYEDIVEMERFPNFQGARVLRFSLKVMGIELGQWGSDKKYRGLQIVILAWVKSNYATLYKKNEAVANECLFDGLVYKKGENKLVQTFPIENLRTEELKKKLKLLKPSV